MYKRFLILFVLFILFGVTTVTATDGNTGTRDTSWYDNDPSAKIFYISTADQLAGLSRIVNSFSGTYESEQFEGKTIILTKDIDVSVYGSWSPIGIFSSTPVPTSFRGTFDGNYKKVTGVRISWGFSGFFGAAEHATIKNLGLVDITVNAEQVAGGIIGTAINVNIENCYVTGTIKGVYDDFPPVIGGIIGDSYNVSIKNSYFDGTITASGGHIGGIIGGALLATIENCYSAGEFTAVGGSYEGSIGGLANHINGSIKNSYSVAAIRSENLDLNPAGGIAANMNGEIINSVALNPTIESKLSVARVSESATLTNTYALADMVLKFEHIDGYAIEDGIDITMPQALTAEFWTDTLGWDTYIWNIQDGELPTLHHRPPFPPTGVGDMRGSMLLMLALSALSALLWTAIFLPRPHHSPTQDG
ncbi:MAG: hypothetical protein FWG87_10010 [Defluviitaleaceae bacterium]|nr:hypothetical protein [Defluviitaleaceae bacterium]